MENWEIERHFTFEAAHKLPDHKGKCARLHGHSYKMTLRIRKDVLCPDGPMRGMVQDFGDVKSFAQPFIDEFLDHRYLNESTGIENPTVENLCKWVYLKLAHLLPGINSISIAETCTSACTYRPS